MPNTEPRFENYRYVDAGVICLGTDRRSSVIYCNHAFAKLLGCNPGDLIGKSLDQIAVNNQPHSTYTREFRRSGDSLGRKMNAGLLVKAYMQGGPKLGQETFLNIYRIEKVDEAGSFYLLGYARKPTFLEMWISRLGTGRRWRRYYRPFLRFFLAGKTRPYLTGAITTTAPIWLPRLVSRFPDVGEVIQNLLGI